MDIITAPPLVIGHLRLFIKGVISFLFLVTILINKIFLEISIKQRGRININSRTLLLNTPIQYYKSQYQQLILRTCSDPTTVLIIKQEKRWSFVMDKNGIKGWVRNSKLRIPKLVFLVSRRDFFCENEVLIRKNAMIFPINVISKEGNICIECIMQNKYYYLILNDNQWKSYLF